MKRIKKKKKKTKQSRTHSQPFIREIVVPSRTLGIRENARHGGELHERLFEGNCAKKKGA